MPLTYRSMYLTIAEGSIDPAERVAAGEISNEKMDEIERDIIAGEFDSPLDANKISCKCVDGRGIEAGPKAAGATMSIVMADALTTQSYRNPGDKAPAHLKRIVTKLQKSKHEVGLHNDDKANAENCGCGACDKLDNQTQKSQPSILSFIERRSNNIKSFLRDNVGVEVDQATNDGIAQRSGELRDEGYATFGSELTKAISDVAGDEVIATVKGKHREFCVIIDMREGVTVDTEKMMAKHGEDYQAFVVNVPNLFKGTAAISLSETEASLKGIAGVYYNVATAAVLAGKSLRVIVMK